MNKADHLIRTKLRLPFIRPELVPRSRLQARIAAGLRGPLTLVIAPAGFGKTTLAASCVAGCGIPAAWLSLDKDDNQAGRFLSYVAAALQEAGVWIGSETAQLLASQPPEIQRSLLHTSILERLTAPLCDAILIDDKGFRGQSASILEYLERANFFLALLDDERQWRCYHHLFADLLRTQLQKSLGNQGGMLLGLVFVLLLLADLGAILAARASALDGLAQRPARPAGGG